MDKLNIQNEMACFDNKVRNFYDELTDDERKKFSNYLMIRWGSSVEGSRELQEFYLIATNERLNKHFFAINRHPKLQWLCATSVSPGMGKFRHTWISTKKKESNSNTTKKTIKELFPLLKEDELELMSKINTQQDLNRYIKDLGEQ